MIVLAVCYEDLSCLKVGDIEVYKNPNGGNVGQLMEGAYPEAPSYDDLTENYVESTEGPEDGEG